MEQLFNGYNNLGLPDGSVGKKSTFSAGDTEGVGQEDPEKEKATCQHFA